MSTKRLSGLASEAGLPFEPQSSDPVVTSVTADSRVVAPGSLFVCMPSKNTDTHAFLTEVKKKGAVAAVVHSDEGAALARSLDLPCVLVQPEQPHFNIACGALARQVFDDPSSKMRVIGVTGTNGKTTTAWMMRDALMAMGRKAGYMGTLGFDVGQGRRELANTTPFPVETWQLLNEAGEAGLHDLVMEASSHALFERRLYGVRFACGVFTNLSQDHLDYHRDMDDYAAAKLLLFTEYAVGSDSHSFVSAVNVGDPVGAKWSKAIRVTVSFGSAEADLQVDVKERTLSSLVLSVRHKGVNREARLRVGGLFNVWNATSAIAGLLALGHGLEECCQAMGEVTPVPGRFESVPNDRGFGVIVDYAHTPDALEKLLQSVRELEPKRVITVFGCGGDRDSSKRPKMARAASENSDVTIVTSDNPRTEDPLAIIADVVKGLAEGAACETVPDRREAVARAVQMAQEGDVVVIAGKGHENYQIIGRTKHAMDDRDLVREALESRR